MTEQGYVFADAVEGEELERIRRLEAWADPFTQRRLDAIGVGSGWRCADVGAGAGSVARWLAERVGPSGTVVAADMAPRFLTDLPTNVDMRRHDIQETDLEADSYDLVHCRFLLMHLPDPRAALVRMVSALKPGGWLLAEEGDWGLCTISGHPDAAWATDHLHDLWSRHVRAGIRQPYLGRKLPGLIARLGLEGTRGDVAAPVVSDGDANLEVIRLTVCALRPASISLGAIEHDLDRLDAVLASSPLEVVGAASVGVSARRLR